MHPVVWVDFENAPNVLVFSPVIKDLRSKGYRVRITARDFSYTLALCRRFALEVEVAGLAGSGKTNVNKTIRIFVRALSLYRLIRQERQNKVVALSFNSRSHILAAHLSRIPIICLEDYEYSNQSLVRFVEHLLVPFPIPKACWGRHANKIVHFPGLKEDLYLCGFKPSKSLPELNDSRIHILFRPEGRFAHYRSAQSEILQTEVLNYLSSHSDIILVLLPRDPEQAQLLSELCHRKAIRHWIPISALDGPDLICQMDAVIGGGGTMTREAAALGVPSYSFFSGRWGAVDQYLVSSGRLVRLSAVEDVQRIVVKRRDRLAIPVSADALRFVTTFIEARLASLRN
jgi:predicted glycosyltransferase